MKKLLSIIALIAALMLISNLAFADLDIERVRYQGNGTVRVDFDVDDDDDDDDYAVYRKPRVAVEDEDFNEYETSILKKNKRFMTFKVKSPKLGRNYSFTITGVREKDDDDFDKLTGKFYIPDAVTPTADKVEYRGKGVVVMTFGDGHAQYKNVSVSVTDKQGNEYSASVQKKEKSRLVFKVNAIKADNDYDFTVTGVSAHGEGDYGTIKGSFHVPSLGAPEIKKIEYEGKGKLEIEFVKKVQYQNLAVTATRDDIVYAGRVKDRDDDEIDVVFRDIVEGRGMRYTLTIEGVCVRGSNDYQTVTATFVAWDDDDDDD